MQNDQSSTSATPADPVEQILAQRKAFETAVTLRAWNDPAFAEQLAQDPVAAINAAFDIELPTDVDIHVHHESPTTLHLALPQIPIVPTSSDELSEDDLERVAGGSFGIAASVVSVGLSVSAASAAASAASATVTAIAYTVARDIKEIKNKS